MQELKLLEPYPLFGPGSETFPDSPEKPDGVISVMWQDPIGSTSIRANTDVVYQSLNGEEQHMHIFTPTTTFPIPEDPEKRYPLIVYVPGSAWHRQNLWVGLERAAFFAARGYTFAIVEYRPSDIAHYPAQIEDVQSAINYLIENADLYRVDKDRIGLWGDSSGGHTVVSLAVSAPTAAKCVVDWFGPVDLPVMNCYPTALDHHSPESPEGYLLGNVNVLEHLDLAQKASPINYISEETPLPPFLIMHGSKDNTVPFNQSVRLYEKLRECGKEATFYRLEGGGHGTGGFNTDACLNTVLEWISERI